MSKSEIMDIQVRKFNLIEYLIGLKDESILSKIESTIFNEKKVIAERDFEPFTQEQLLGRAKKSNDDYIAGRIKTQEQLEKESANW